MLIGYNTNVPYKGQQYHVQTEDSGLANPFIVTLLYHKGEILRSARTSYAHIIGHPDFETELRELMKTQHREMIKYLITGKSDVEQGGIAADSAEGHAGNTAETANPEKAQKRVKSLDDILLEHIAKKVKQ